MKIWKFPLELKEEQDIEMPAGAKILSIQVQVDTPCLWAEVDPNEVRERRKFLTAPTGGDVPQRAKYVGTYMHASGHWVFHVYESVT